MKRSRWARYRIHQWVRVPRFRGFFFSLLQAAFGRTRSSEVIDREQRGERKGQHGSGFLFFFCFGVALSLSQLFGSKGHSGGCGRQVSGFKRGADQFNLLSFVFVIKNHWSNCLEREAEDGWGRYCSGLVCCESVTLSLLTHNALRPCVIFLFLSVE